MSNEALHYLEEIAGGVVKRPNEVLLIHVLFQNQHNGIVHNFTLLKSVLVYWRCGHGWPYYGESSDEPGPTAQVSGPYVHDEGG